MHRLAELEAAHWDYKLGSKSDPTTSLTVKQSVNPMPASSSTRDTRRVR
jgi:(p)ppGpp synthase/HD superfamily hydrolase